MAGTSLCEYNRLLKMVVLHVVVYIDCTRERVQRGGKEEVKDHTWADDHSNPQICDAWPSLEECVCALLSPGGTLLASPAGLHLQGLKLVAGSVQSSSAAAGQADTLRTRYTKPTTNLRRRRSASQPRAILDIILRQDSSPPATFPRARNTCDNPTPGACRTPPTLLLLTR